MQVSRTPQPYSPTSTICFYCCLDTPEPSSNHLCAEGPRKQQKKPSPSLHPPSFFFSDGPKLRQRRRQWGFMAKQSAAEASPVTVIVQTTPITLSLLNPYRWQPPAAEVAAFSRNKTHTYSSPSPSVDMQPKTLKPQQFNREEECHQPPATPLPPYGRKERSPPTIFSSPAPVTS